MKTKKGLLIILMLAAIMALTASCSQAAAPASNEEATDAAVETAAEVSVDYGSSEIYTKEDMDAAIKLIEEEFAGWKGCEMHSIRYASDDCNSEENIKWVNEQAEGKNYTQCIQFNSDFHSPVDGGDAWEADTEYTDWQWWLARTADEGWQVLTWGY